ncbi:hypothetical protein GPALN_011609 [Globodera pallida]|nr:hypothetical protein GPALN_011609 [Globodera pallida]
MHPMFCFVVLTAIVGIEAQFVNVQPKKDDDLVELLDVGRCLKAVKNFCPCGWAKCVRRKDDIWSNFPGFGPIMSSFNPRHALPDFLKHFFLPASKKCRKEMKEICPCGWAVCSRNMGALSDKCCPDNYSVVCCASADKCIDECVESERAASVNSVNIIGKMDVDELMCTQQCATLLGGSGAL